MLTSSYILCKLWGFFKENFSVTIWYIGLNFQRASGNEKPMLMSQYCKERFLLWITWFTVITGVRGMIVMKRKSRITGVTRMNGVMR